jgi:hypothetical protein
MTHRHTNSSAGCHRVFAIHPDRGRSHNFQVLPGEDSGPKASWAYGVNNSGVIVGQYFDANHVGHGFMLNEGARALS